MKAGGADPDDIMLAKAKYQGQLNEYTRFCKKMGLEQQRERIYYDMRGRVAPTKSEYQKYKEIERKKMEASKAVKSIANVGKGDIIKIEAQPGSAKYREIKRQKIIEKGITNQKPIFAADTFGQFVKNVPRKKGFYDVALHGAPKYASFFGERINAETLANIVSARNDYDGTSAIRLLSCSTGKGDACFAQVLANKLGVPVEAPTDIIWVRPDGSFTIGPTKYKNTGKMATFYPEGE